MSGAGKKVWLVLSYRAAIDGSACSQHIDDRLAAFRDQGVEPVLLTGPVGDRHAGFAHYRAWSLAPSGIRFELRHFLKKRFPNRLHFKLIETVLLLPVMPFYLLEKLLINLESEWSWCFAAAVRGLWLVRRYRPEVLYTTGGSASAHIAGCLIKRLTGTTWIAETQDPLVHDRDWRRGARVLRLYQALERCIAARADWFVFLCQGGRESMARRTGMGDRTRVVIPGSLAGLFPARAIVREGRCSFAHFGSLAGTRNLVVFFRALGRLLVERPEWRTLARVDLYGSFDADSSAAMRELGLADLVHFHGRVSRQESLAAMRGAGCLLLIQNLIFFSCETIPSKVYEYLLAGPPILGLVHDNPELAAMLRDGGHLVAPADDLGAVAAGIEAVLERFAHREPWPKGPAPGLTVDRAVARLVALAAEPRE